MVIHYKDVTNIVKRYLSEKEIQLLDKAFLYAQTAHKGQKRASGEDFIHHPLAVTLNLAIHRASTPTLMAGLLHDVVEDCDVTLEDIEKEFGKDIASLVDGVTKIDSLTNTSRTEISASNIKKILLSGVSDVRVLIIKLCDRLHNITTLDSLSDQKRKRIALETLDIYSPLALKLSLFDINKTFEEEAFQWAYPEENQAIERRLKDAKITATKLHGEVISKINRSLRKNGIKNAVVLSRQKTNYSIYKKVYLKGKSWDKLFDLLAIRVIVKDIASCFAALGVMHKTFKHIPKTFKDYITIPKINGYQSLHTCVSSEGFVFEAQIRTEVMDRNANIGIAATWTYKENEKETMLESAESKESWLLDIQNLSDSKLKDAEFVENVYSDITSRNIYTFTPNNDIIIINRGASAIDFAYKVHSWLGDHFSYAVVNNQRVDFDHVLRNGSVVQIVTSDKIQVVTKWLNAAKTKYAKLKIKKSLNSINAKETAKYVSEGKSIASIFLAQQEIKKLNYKKIGNYYDLVMKSQDDIFQAIGRKIISLEDLRLLTNVSKAKTKKINLHEFIVDDKNYKGKVNLAKCCKPIPGDIISGVMKSTLAIAHRVSCNNKGASSNDSINLAWKNSFHIGEKPYVVKLQIDYNKNDLVINKILSRITRNKINIINIQSKQINQQLFVSVEVFNANQLYLLRKNIESIPIVKQVKRQ